MNLFTPCQVPYSRTWVSSLTLSQEPRVSKKQVAEIQLRLHSSEGIHLALRLVGSPLRRGTTFFGLAAADVQTLSFPRCRGVAGGGWLERLDVEPRRLDLGLAWLVLFV